MNNNIKLLVENLFDDNELDNLFVDQEQEYNDIAVNNLMIKAKEQLYDYIVEKYNLKSIKDCSDERACPKILDLTDIIVYNDFDTTDLFRGFKCEEINISNWKITTIKSYTFAHCINLKSITLPPDVKYIEDWAFLGCKNLNYVYYPKGAELNDFYVFWGCHRIKERKFI